MNKSEARSLWSALNACTCKPGVYQPYDCVCCNDAVIYTTDRHVVNRVEGIFKPGTMFRALYRTDCAYAPRVNVLDEFLKYTVGSKRFENTCDYFDPALVMRALRVHKAAGAKHIRFLPSASQYSNAPLIIRSEIQDNHGHIIITSAVQGMRK